MSAIKEQKKVALQEAELELRRAQLAQQEEKGDADAVQIARQDVERARIELREVELEEARIIAEGADHSDFDMIMYLENLLQENTSTGKCLLTMIPGQGLSLVESDSVDAKPSVREAIQDYILNNS